MTQETKPTGVKRREFLKVLGASSATLAITACDEPTGKLIPYLVSPDQITVRTASVERPSLYGAIPIALQSCLQPSQLLNSAYFSE